MILSQKHGNKSQKHVLESQKYVAGRLDYVLERQKHALESFQPVSAEQEYGTESFPYVAGRLRTGFRFLKGLSDFLRLAGAAGWQRSYHACSGATVTTPERLAAGR